MLHGGASTHDIGVRGLVKRYGTVTALDRVQLDIVSGEFVTLLGPSGSGKTTLLMVLAGFVRPDAGDLLLGDRSIVRLPPHRRNMGMVFQKHALFPHMSVFDNIAYPLRLRGLAAPEIRSKVEDVLSLVQLDGYGERRIEQLSGGQSQRVAVARAIVYSPGILLMDEPLSALDKNLREQLQIEIRSLHDRLGLTTVYVTHDQREALTMSDRIVVMNHGRIAQVATPRQLYDQPADSFVAEFMGETTLVPVDFDSAGPSVLGARLASGDLPAASSRKLFLVLRPGIVEISADPEPDFNYIYFTGSAVRPIFEGESTLHQVDCGNGIVLRTRKVARGEQGTADPETGEQVLLKLHRRNILLVPEAAP